MLDRVDKLMDRDGFPHFRYMDDIRLVVNTEAEARRALVRLVTHLRELGLGLNTAKTQIVRPGSPDMSAHVAADDADVSAIEQAISTKDRQTVQSIVTVLFNKAEGLKSSATAGSRIFRFCLNRIASLRQYRNLDLPEAAGLTDAVLALLVTRPAETDTYCRYLEVAPLRADQAKEIERLLVDEPLCVYPWQNFHLWRLVAQRQHRSDSLVRRAHSLVSGDRSSPESGAAALYLGACGDYADRQTIGRAISSCPTGLVRRCFHIAMQGLHKAERGDAIREISDDDGQSEMLRTHLDGLGAPIYVDDPPAVAIDDLPDAMPSVYA